MAILIYNMTQYHKITIHHRRELCQVYIDGQLLFRTRIHREEASASDFHGGNITRRTQFGQLGDDGQSFWKRIHYSMHNPTLDDFEWTWEAPTLFQLQELDVPRSMHGKGLPAVTDAEPRDAAFSEYGAGGPPFRMADLEKLPRPYGRHTLMQSLQWREAEGRRKMVRTRKWKYVHDPMGDKDELYDLENDPWELENVVYNTSNREALAEMRLRLANGVSGPKMRALCRCQSSSNLPVIHYAILDSRSRSSESTKIGEKNEDYRCQDHTTTWPSESQLGADEGIH